MTRVILLLTGGRGNSGDYDLTIMTSPEKLKNPPLDEEWIENPKGVNHHPDYDDKPIMKQPIYNPDRSLDRGQIVVRPTNNNIKYSKNKKVTVLLKSDRYIPDDEPNQFNINDGELLYDKTAKNSVRSTKNYAPEQNSVQPLDLQTQRTRSNKRVLNNDQTLDSIKRSSRSKDSQEDKSWQYPKERDRNNKIVRFQEDAFNLKDDVKITNDKSQRNSSPRLSNGKNVL